MMTLDQNYVGIDISKAWLDLGEAAGGARARFGNNAAGLAQLCRQLRGESATLVVLEATGHYDRALRAALDAAAIGYIRVNPLRARDFARSLGRLAKTDAIDAGMLALMGAALKLAPGSAPDPAREALASLSRRRDQLVAMRASEKHHREAASPSDLDSIERHLSWLSTEIETLEQAITQAIAASEALAAANRQLRSAPGIGPVAAATLLALLPELGRRSDKAIAALAGLAPFNRDSGTTRGTRHIGAGRRRVRQALYMAALNAIRSPSSLKTTYARLRNAGKPAKLALIAVARKLLIILNAMLRDDVPFRS